MVRSQVPEGKHLHFSCLGCDPDCAGPLCLTARDSVSQDAGVMVAQMDLIVTVVEKLALSSLARTICGVLGPSVRRQSVL